MSASRFPSNARADAKPPATLASAAFPRRIRRLLEGVLEYTSDELERVLKNTLDDVEQQLFKLAEQARSNEVQQSCFEALRTLKRGRPDLTPRFMVGLEAELAQIRGGGHARHRRAAASADHAPAELTLVATADVDEDSALREIASRIEIRSSLPLYLLGQRFGVLAGGRALDPEQLPVGPHALCDLLAEAIHCLELSPSNRLLVFRQFDRQLGMVYAELIEAINNYLINEGVLPHLNFVPVRARGQKRRQGGATVQGEAEPPAKTETAKDGGVAPDSPSPAATARRRAPAPAQPAPGGTPEPPVPVASTAPLTAWPGFTTPAFAGLEDDNGGSGAETFGLLRKLLANRRAVLGKLSHEAPASTRESLHMASEDDVQSVLCSLQARPTHSVIVDGKPATRTMAHIKQDLLTQLRRITPEGKAPALRPEDNDIIDLLVMLFDTLMRDVRPHSPAATLLTKLQVPLLRVALRDPQFFTERKHPARQMLNAVAESSAYWAADSDSDHAGVEKMQMLVDRVVSEFDGDVGVFDTLLHELGTHMQTLARKAEVSERRHVDAARGKEKLALARIRAGEEVGKRLKGKRVPRFVKTLLTEAWADVLALSLLRNGEDSTAFSRQLAIADQLIARATRDKDKPVAEEDTAILRDEITQALVMVGYHPDDAGAIAGHLANASEPDSEDDPTSRTELALRLKARARLGSHVGPEDQAKATAKGTAKAQATLSPEEKAALERIKALPFGTWFEFRNDPAAPLVRRRMSWFSTVTGNILFVNYRGQRVGEETLESLARAMVAGNAAVVEVQKASLFERAWNSVVSALRAFSGNKPALTGGAA